MHPARLSNTGLVLGTLLFAFSLTPSLVPRGHVMQGILAGLSFGAGYGAGVLGTWLWTYLELPEPSPRALRWGTVVAGSVSALTALVFLWQAAEWQNSVRTLMEMEPVETARPFRVGALALLVFGVLLAFARTVRRVFLVVSGRLQPSVPARVSHVIGVAVAITLAWSLVDGVLLRYALRAADWSYRQADALVQDDLAPPGEASRTGSPASLLEWPDLGSAGRRFVSAGPTAGELGAVLGEEAIEPLRVYVGLQAAPTPRERARLALEELERVGAFERSMLVLVTPTGTGWIDPAAIDTVEQLHRGDVASVAVQYSYLASPLALLVEGEYGAETARALFDEIYRHWSALEPDARPELYLHGLSLGALNSDLSFELFDIVDDPFQGVLWAGPPFRSETWRSTTRRRDLGSPPWRPVFRDGAVVRFMTQDGGLDLPEASWGSFRIVFLQHASDPITFFEPDALYREPEWMAAPRGPDVSPALRWYPVVTMLQLAADMLAGSEPTGYGHEYAARDYIRAWHALTEPAGWTAEGLERLEAFHAERAAAQAAEGAG